jgi:ATP-dependent DNA helicase PIF1
MLRVMVFRFNSLFVCFLVLTRDCVVHFVLILDEICKRSTAWKRWRNGSPPAGQSIVLRRIYRQTDGAFLNLLGEIRIGRVTDERLRYLNERCCRALSSQDGIVATRLFPLNRDVDAINAQRLAELPAREVQYKCEDCLHVMLDEGSEQARKAQALASDHPLFGSVGLAPLLTLKVGAQVMLLCNLSEQMGLVNGSRGVVVGFKPWQLPKQHERNALMKAFFARYAEIPVVKFASVGPPIDVEPREKEASSRDAAVWRVQIPLSLAW